MLRACRALEVQTYLLHPLLPGGQSIQPLNIVLVAGHRRFMVTADLEIDATGLACPMPLLKAKQGLNQLAVGQCLRITASDPGSVRDFHSFAKLSSHQLIAFEEVAGSYIYMLRKG